MGVNFRGKSENALFMVLNFVIATSPGAWHCTSDDVHLINTHARSRS